MAKRKRIINVKVLPGEPLDGSGRVCIHLFVPDPKGPFVEPHALHPVYENGIQVKQKVQVKPTRGRLACNPKRTVAPVTRNGITCITMRTNDHRAVTCIECLASKDYKTAEEKLACVTQVSQAPTEESK